MSARAKKILRISVIALVSLIAMVAVTAIIVVRTAWFRDAVRSEIVRQTELATGGTVEVGSFSFSWANLEAVVTDFVIHGNEPAGAAPFVRIARLQVNLRLFTSLRRLYDISYLGVDSPQANIMVLPSGQTNVPSPKQKSTSNKTALETVVDLAIGRFDVRNGLFTFNEQKTPISARGDNLTARLDYNFATQRYAGRFSVNPLHVVQGHNMPLDFSVTAPVVLERDRISVSDAKIGTANSGIQISATVDNLRDPRTSAHVTGRIALVDVQKATGASLALNAANVPQTIDADISAYMDASRITINNAHVAFGQSNVDGSGALEEPSGQQSMRFRASLDLDQIRRVVRSTSMPTGRAQLDGEARVSTTNVEVSHLRLAAFGGDFTGDAGVENMRTFHLNGSLHNFDTLAVVRAFGETGFAYDGVVSGPVDARGDLKAPGTRGVNGRLQLTIAAGRHGIPVSGRLVASYDGARDDVVVSNSYLNLPHTRVNLSGSTASALQVQLTSKNLDDLLAAAGPSKGPPPVTLTGGTATVNATISGTLATPRIAAHALVTNFSIEDRHFDRLSADLVASPSGASIQNGSLARGTLAANFSGTVGLKQWKAGPYAPLAATIAMRNADLADLLALAGQRDFPASGSLNADARIGGTVGNPTGSANLNVINGAVYDEPFDRLEMQANLSDQLVSIPAAYIVSGPARVDLNASFRHPRDSFSTGSLRAHMASNQISLAQIQALQKRRPGTAGILRLNVDVAGNMRKEGDSTAFMLTSVNADASAGGLRFDNQNYGDIMATARTSGDTVTYRAKSDFAGSNLQLDGTTTLARGYPTTATASVGNLPVERALAAAQRTDIPVKGLLSATARFSGTIDNPNASADVTLTKAVLCDEPVDRAETKISYTAQDVNVPMLRVTAGSARLEASADLTHPKGDFQTGHLRFRVEPSTVQLANIRNVQERRPGLAGTLRISADGEGTLDKSGVRLTDLNADVNGSGLEASKQQLGDIKLAAHTAGGEVNFNLDSDLAGADIHGRGKAGLNRDYPVNAQLSFRNATWSRLRPLIGNESEGMTSSLEVTADGNVTVSGPLAQMDSLDGTLELSRLQVATAPSAGTRQPVAIANQGPVTLALADSVITIRSAHLAGPSTDFTANGTVSLSNDRPLNLTVRANADLKLARDFSSDIYSGGAADLAATIHGTLAQPRVNGKVELRDASFTDVNFPNGVSHANGIILFNGNNATIQTLTAQSGGGKISLSGFVGITSPVRYGIKATARNVRVRESNISVTANATVNLTGTTERGLASGDVIIEKLGFDPQSDFGSLLSRSAPPVQTPTRPSPMLDNLRLDLRIRTSPALAVQSSLAQDIEASADLHLRGTASEPGMLGRVSITSGDVVFFGTKYTVNEGTISFYDPLKIEPNLDISLETQSKGVDVTLNVTGPIDNMKLTYTSDPPLQFEEIVGLLAAGRVPTSDPVIAANQPITPPQTYQQMGESALVGQAIANPVAGQLQRVFGVSQLKISPSFVSGSDVPQARMTLQQQVSTNLTFTYETDMSNPNDLLVRAEWAFDPKWSVVAERDEFGRFGIEFFFKKQFR